MAGISGKNGKVEVTTSVPATADAAEITGWRYTETSNNPAWASSGTAGHKTRVAGVGDGSGSADFKYDPDITPADVGLVKGALVTLKLYINAVVFHTISAIIDSISYEVDVNDGETVSGSFDFSDTAAPTMNAS